MKKFEKHKYFSYKIPKTGRRIIREIAKDILNVYLNNNLGITKLKKLGVLKLICKENNKEWISDNISFSLLEKHISDGNRFNHKDFNAIEIKCPWLDGTIDLALFQHLVASDNKAVKYQLPFGKKFPIAPLLDREGLVINSFLKKLSLRIVNLHNKLVDNSNKFYLSEWLFDLLGLISCCVSLVDIHLNHIYIKAEYDPLKDWTFDKKKLGDRYNRRMKDKFNWIKHITGNTLDNIDKEIKSFNILKFIRNHTQHFDPPFFCCSLEEVATWLNMVSDIGILIYKIRKKMKSPLNESLIKIMLLPEVQFHGWTLFDRIRLPQNKIGYETTIWPVLSKEKNEKKEYICPSCEVTIWSKNEVNAICNICSVKFVEVINNEKLL